MKRTNQHVYLFPGQGLQEKGMGAQLFQQYPDYVFKANKILGFSIQELCLENPENKLFQVAYSHPAIYMVNALSYLNHIRKEGLPDMLLGHSLGEFNALCAAGVYDFETGLELVQKQGLLLSAFSNGTMAIILGMPLEEVKGILAEYGPDIDIANINAPGQTVISGLKKDIITIEVVFEQAGAIFIPLDLGVAFHSHHLQSAQAKFSDYLQQFAFLQPKIPVISNVQAKPYRQEQVGALLTAHVCKPILWQSSMEYTLQQGPCSFFEAGSKNTLTNLLRRIKKPQFTLTENTWNETI